MTSPTCFNCRRTDGVGAYSFDMDLPDLHACHICVTALSMGDQETLEALRPRTKKTKTGRQADDQEKGQRNP